ncbi:MAG: YchJ family protein [Gammaproteobacteria bacterium]|nr:YchJ family protein [Gammaproteobacteria bacterium]
MSEGCHCGSGQSYLNCCGRYITASDHPPTAEALMRSRYTAYVLGHEAYLLQTWHQTTRPEKLSLQGGDAIEWLGLSVDASERGDIADSTGVVEFTVHYRAKSKMAVLRERSQFVQECGQWFYVDGQMREDTVGRNSPCPCGSEKKYKRCCGQ